MQEDTLKIIAGQYLSETDAFQNGTPSDYVIFKKLPGLGATHGECLYQRHSIILEPNTPVLVGKRDALDNDGQKIYPDILIVFEGVSIEEISKYLNGETQYKKILCTPEAYITKVKPAVEQSEYDLFEDFFMLLDESDRLIKDVGYRDKIILPVRDFFHFKSKAMISATALKPSDPRFASQGFKILNIEPQYEFKKDIRIVSTNNVLGSLDLVIKEYKNERIFIFINSIELIRAFIQKINIEEESKVFCASKSARKLRRTGFTNVSDELGEFAKYNFLTSRYFSAVDIKIDEKPNIIIVTHNFRAPHSRIDPYTDTVQISGRLRNGISKITHISNFDTNIKWEKREDAISTVKEGFETFHALRIAGSQFTTDVSRLVVDTALNRDDFAIYMGEDSELNYFMLDNYLLDQKVNSHYVDEGSLKKGYLETDYFQPTVVPHNFDMTDSQVLSLEQKSGNALYIENIATILHKNDSPRVGGLMVFNLGPTNDDIRRDEPALVEIYENIGFFKMREVDFNRSKMNALCKIEIKRKKLENPIMIAEIQSLYSPGQIITEIEFKNALKQCYVKFGIDGKALASFIRNYYNVSATTKNVNNKCYHGFNIISKMS